MSLDYFIPEPSQTAAAWINESLKSGTPSTDRVQWQSSPTSSATLNKLRKHATLPQRTSALLRGAPGVVVMSHSAGVA